MFNDLVTTWTSNHPNFSHCRQKVAFKFTLHFHYGSLCGKKKNQCVAMTTDITSSKRNLHCVIELSTFYNKELYLKNVIPSCPFFPSQFHFYELNKMEKNYLSFAFIQIKMFHLFLFNPVMLWFTSDILIVFDHMI